MFGVSAGMSPPATPKTNMTTTTTEYVIRQTRSFYGPTTERSLVTGDNGEALTFGSDAEAKAHIEELDAETYHTAHNESGRPDYSVLRADKLPAYLAHQL